MSTRTLEGLELKLHFSFLYRLQKENIPELYRLVGIEYEKLYVKIAADLVLANAGNYVGAQYWQQRSMIGDELQKALNAKLNEAYADCTGFMLLKIDLPDSYEGAIVDTQLVHQQRLTQEKIKQVSLIQARMDVDRAIAYKNITIINAEAQHDSVVF